MAPISALGEGRLALCAAFLVVVVMLSRLFSLEMEKRIVVAAVRCAIQLTVLCVFLLEPMFSHSRKEVIFPYLGLILVLAAREGSNRVVYAYEGLQRHFVAAFCCGAGCTVVFAVCVVLSLDPWWNPRYLVPIAGMLLGNQLTATSLCANAYLKELHDGGDRVSLRLGRGASWVEAAMPSLRQALVLAMTPTLNSMSVMGLVMMPGMMTGAILGGAPPLEAGLYQIMIMYLVCCSNALATSAVVLLSSLTVFDTREHVLRDDKIVHVDRGPKRDLLVECAYGTVDLVKRTFVDDPCDLLEKGDAPRSLYTQGGDTPEGHVALAADGLIVERTGLVANIRLCSGTVAGIVGPTGIGKSTTLKALARLEARLGGRLSLGDADAKSIPAPDWRARVLFVAHERPTVVGTPQGLYDAVRSYRAQRRRAAKLGTIYDDDAPSRFAAKWGLDPGKFCDQTWATLSGGEAQRCSLAIALALRPDVLLLDEPTSALDANTIKLVEADLRTSAAAILLASNSPEKANRLASRLIHIVSASQ